MPAAPEHIFLLLSQSEIATLEAKLVDLREQRSSILSSISEEERRIGSIHEELSSENGQLAEERRQIEKKEEQLQVEVVSEGGGCE